MKIILSLGIVFSIFLSVFGQTTTAPEPTPDPSFKCPDREEGYYPHPTDCTAYYHCTNGLAWYTQCADGLYFDPVNKRCNWPWEVDCEAEGNPTDDPDVRGVSMIGPDPDYECNPDNNGAFPHEEFCEYFYDCFDGLATLAVCTDLQLFDLTYDGCNWAADVHCGNRTRPDGYPTPKPTTTKDPNVTEKPQFPCPEPDGLFADPEDCGAYYSCAGNTSWHNHCPFNLLFNPVLSVCDHPGSVDCEDRPIPRLLNEDDSVISLIRKQFN